jgi:hypothetical protein
LTIAPDGKITSLKDGQIPGDDIIKRSSNDVINQAALKAIAEGPLPAVDENERQASPITLVIKFEPVINNR